MLSLAQNLVFTTEIHKNSSFKGKISLDISMDVGFYNKHLDSLGKMRFLLARTASRKKARMLTSTFDEKALMMH